MSGLIRKRKLTKNQQRRISQNNQFDGDDNLLTQAIIVSHFGKQLDVQIVQTNPKVPTLIQGQIYRCHTRTNLPMLTTGDKVWISYDDIAKLGRIEKLDDRKTLITRPDRYHKIKPVAANVGMLVIVFAALPKPATQLIDRYLLISHITGVPALLVLNKSDLLDEYPEVLQIYQEYQSLGVDIIQTSRHNSESIKILQNRIHNQLSIFAGQSGVGKSSLINQLIPTANQDTNHISHSSKLGQHTTTTSRLLPYNSENLDQGGIIDTPGIREYGIWHLSADEILAAFPELYALNGDCQFRDCTHNPNIKGCAFWQAATDGRVLARRVQSLLQLQQEAQNSL